MILGINDIGMFRKYLTLIIFCFFSISFSAYASPEEDLEELQEFFENRFPNIPFKEYNNGAYSIDSGLRE